MEDIATELISDLDNKISFTIPIFRRNSGTPIRCCYLGYYGFYYDFNINFCAKSKNNTHRFTNICGNYSRIYYRHI
ncbi:MAG: hypothetical protein ACFWTJ_12620 [Lachnoclostridium sp.]